MSGLPALCVSVTRFSGRLAGYAGNRVTLAPIGSKTRRVPRIAAAIDEELLRVRAESEALLCEWIHRPYTERRKRW